MAKNIKVSRALRRTYSNLARAVNAAADLQQALFIQQDERTSKATKVIDLIMKAQDILNPIAEDEDIYLP